jgi:cleavage and polyadenylation specificity factor subunit 1
MRKVVFAAVHELAHPGVRATRRLVSSRFIWKSCAADVNQWCRDCVGRARAKVQVHLKTQPEQIQIPDQIFQHVHVDLVGPLPVSENNQAYIMTVIDRTSRWAEAVPLTSVTAEKCA